MGARGFRILCRNDPNLPYSVIVVSTRSENSLLLESSAAVTLVNNESTMEYKKAYARVTDGYGLIDDSFLLVVTGVLSVGQINSCGIYRVSAVQFVLLKTPSEVVDPRMADREVAVGEFPYPRFNDNELFFQLQQVVYGDAPIMGPSDVYSIRTVQFINSCLVKETNARPDYKTLMNTEFFKYYDSLDGTPSYIADYVRNALEGTKQMEASGSD